MEAPDAEMSLSSSMVGDLVDLLLRPQMGHPANALLRAPAVTQLQRRRGSGYVQDLTRSGTIRAKQGASPPGNWHDREVARVAQQDIRIPEPSVRGRPQVTPESASRVRAPGGGRQALASRVCGQMVVASRTDLVRITDPSEAAEREALAIARECPDDAPTARQRLAEGAIARDLATLVTEAETRVGTTREVGTMLGPGQQERVLTDVQHREIAGLIPGSQPLAVSRAWSYLSLPGRWRIFPPPYVTENLGRVNGVQVPGVARLDAVTIPYVLASPECFGAERSEHWRHHGPGEIRAIIQVSPRVLDGSPEEAASRLVSTLLHEYTHVEWYLAEGFHERIGFLPVDRAVGTQEILSLEPLLSERESPEALGGFQRSSAVMEALGEISAHCTEIENAERTRLARTLQIKETVDELWRYYRRCVGRLNGAQPDAGVAARVHRCIHRGRRVFESYLDSAAGRPYQRHREFLLERCAEGYDVNLFPVQVRGTS